MVWFPKADHGAFASRDVCIHRWLMSAGHWWLSATGNTVWHWVQVSLDVIMDALIFKIADTDALYLLNLSSFFICPTGRALVAFCTACCTIFGAMTRSWVYMVCIWLCSCTSAIPGRRLLHWFQIIGHHWHVLQLLSSIDEFVLVFHRIWEAFGISAVHEKEDLLELSEFECC